MDFNSKIKNKRELIQVAIIGPGNREKPHKMACETANSLITKTYNNVGDLPNY
jgi:hypothetical protein